MLRFTRHPALWLAGLLVWFGTLWALSSLHSAGPRIDVRHIDKLMHFGYFLGGGWLFAGWRFRLAPAAPDWRRIFFSTVTAMALVGAIDEWHQTYTPGRSGGDPWDWTADLLGGAAGALALRAVHQRLWGNS